MAFLKGNKLLEQLSGIIGRQLVFRQTARGTVVTAAPAPRKTSSVAQLAQQKRFREATAKAKSLLASNPGYRQQCLARAQERGLSALNIAVSDCLRRQDPDEKIHND